MKVAEASDVVVQIAWGDLLVLYAVSIRIPRYR